ncbi:MAG: DUF2163 domain-containing protein [Oscillatoriales cyanobacterium SM2_2_1]|nr:DUF2163 domain-containing protein [Oscillatoriales cyanobacterium SM2_2_1]
MLNLSDRFRQNIESETPSLARFWLITRKDGVSLAYTNHDEPVAVGGVVYLPLDGFTANNTNQTNTLAVDNTEISSVLTDDRITEKDLIGGVFDSARVDIFDANPLEPPGGIGENPLAYIPILINGVLGRVETTDIDFRAEVSSRLFRLDQKIGELTSKSCRAQLGDNRCTVNLTPFTFTGTVTQIVSPIFFFSLGLSQPFQFFSNGLITFTSGANEGFETEVAFSTIDQVLLFEEPPNDLSIGDTYTIVAGCNKSREVCRDKFQNAINFQGEPDVPGNLFYANGGQGQ